MIDLHCHVLPGVDDGPRDVEGSIALARGAVADGITTIAATPHVDFSHLHLDADRIAAEVAALQAALDAACVAIKIVTGGELAATRAVELDDAQLNRLKLGGGPWLLLECPLSRTQTPGFAGIARALAWRGHRILLAHPERSPLFLRAPELLDELVDEGMLVQVTAGALSGRFGKTVRALGMRLVDRGTAHVVASDGHNSERPAQIAAELHGTGIAPAIVTWLARDVPAALLEGRALPARPQITAARGRRFRVLGVARRQRA